LENKVRTRIEIKIGNEDVPDLHVIGQVDEEIVDQTLRFFGLRYSPPTPPVVCKPLRVNCTEMSECLDYPEKCGSCTENKMEHLFKAKEGQEQPESE